MEHHRRNNKPESTLVAEFARRDRLVRKAAGWWAVFLISAGLSEALLASWIVWAPVLVAFAGIVALALWAWHCPRCGEELEINPESCKACGLVLRQDEPSTRAG